MVPSYRLRLRPLAVAAIALAATPAQARRGEAPVGRVGPAGERETAGTFFVPAIPLEALRVDEEPVRAGEPYRFAEPIATQLRPETHGTWEDRADGSRFLASTATPTKMPTACRVAITPNRSNTLHSSPTNAPPTAAPPIHQNSR